MSMRHLALLTGINVGTISKMVTGKQRVNPEYLQKMAHHLSVPTEVLFKAAGFDLGIPAVRGEDTSLETIREIVKHTGLDTQQFSKNAIEQELLKYESYAKTKEGQELIVDKFPGKRIQISGTGPFVEYLDEMYRLYLQTEISEEERAVLGSGLLYFVLATDTIPDFIFPIGYLDDALAVQITRDRLSRLLEGVQGDN